MSTQLTLKDAARAVGKNPSTITRAAKSGELSFTRDARGQRLFDTSELVRVYGELISPEEQARAEANMPPMLDVGAVTIIEAKERELEVMQERVDELKERVNELKREKESQLEDAMQERDRWYESAQAGQLLLEHAKSNPQEPGRRKPLWKFWVD